MKLEGIHHITAITGDAPRNVDFYTRVLGLRLVKKTVNQDDPTVYHLFYADEDGDPGSDLTFFEYPGLPQGQAGEGMVHRVVWRVGSSDAQDFWAERLADNDTASEKADDALVSSTPRGWATSWWWRRAGRAADRRAPRGPGRARAPGLPRRARLQLEPEANRRLFEEGLAFEPVDGGWESRGEERGGFYWPETPPLTRPSQGAGTVHHVAWSAGMEEQEEWRERVAKAGGRPTR